MHLEGISKDDITGLELETGVPLVYTLDKEGKVLTKKVLTHQTEEKSGEKE
jgi:2,3-bisphosphoglycerate-dependent phosphoglycerate mutase